MSQEDLHNRLLITFTTELEEQLAVMNSALLAIESTPDDAGSLRTLFRSAHTIKGAARVVGLSAIEQLCHVLETRFAAARDTDGHLSGADVTLCFASIDVLQLSASRLREAEPLPSEAIDALLRRFGSEEISESAEANLVGSTTGADGGATAAARPEHADTVRVPAERLDALLAGGTQLLNAAARIQGNAVAWSGITRKLLRASAPVPDPALQNAVRRAAHEAALARRDSAALLRVTAEVSHTIRLLRVRAIGDAMEALPRAVRDVASRSGKNVELILEGTELEVDRAVVDALREPLLHLVRNAVDHGIERPEDRRAAAKPPRGRVIVRAALQRDRLVVSVDDDGSGIDEQAIRRRLREAGRTPPTTSRELANLLLDGGISRLTVASEISGRGVGLDLARAALKRIGGTLELRWQPGRGTTVVLEAPPAPALVRVLIFEVDGHPFAVPTGHVERLLRVSGKHIRAAGGPAVVAVDERPVPVAAAAALLGPPFRPHPPGDVVDLVVLNGAEGMLALRVDRLLAEQEAVVRPLPMTSGAPSFAGGAALLASGTIALVLNPGALIGVGLPQADTQAGPAAAAEERPRVLIVDDSITTRTLEQSVLDAAGFDTRTAVDGEDAWHQLLRESFAAVVADIEMPRMDGLELCRRLRASRKHATIAVVLVTGRESAEDRTRGMEAGADAYITKSSFDQSALIDTLRQLIG